ncbi:hypothetical protein ACFX16_032442 [Malus domestica]
MPDQLATIEGDYLATKPMMAHVIEARNEESSQKGLPKQIRKEPEKVYSDRMVFNRPSMTLANHLKPIYVTAHLERVPFKRVLIDGRVAVKIIPLKKMKKFGRSEEDLIHTDLIVFSFSRAITKTHEILPLEVDLGSKQIMLAFFVGDSTSTYGVLLDRD